MSEQKGVGLVLEGGAMRGLFTCGVLDAFMEQDIRLDGVIGVSAGACFGCNYVSRQPGRAFRYNMAYRNNWHYSGLRSLLKTGDLFGVDVCYREIPEETFPFDAKTFYESEVPFYVTVTDMDTGEAVYHRCVPEDRGFAWLQASASMPMVSRPVVIDGKRYLDGGIADSIPLEWMEGQGYERNVVVLTRPRDYEKQHSRMEALFPVLLHGSPALVQAMRTRPDRYNASQRAVFEAEKEGRAFVICPDKPLPVSRVDHEKEHLATAYEMGRATAYRQLEALAEFLKNASAQAGSAGK